MQANPTPKEIADQLRMPTGEFGHAVAHEMAKGNSRLIQLAFTAARPQQGEHLLEIGFGGGHHVQGWFEQAQEFSYSGIDYSEAMVNLAQHQNQELRASQKASFQFGDVSNLAFPDHHFDLVVSVNTLYFWPDVAKGLAEIKRVLKPNGRLILGLRPKTSVEHLAFTKFGFVLFDPPEVESILNNNGFHSIGHYLEEEPGVEFNGEWIEPFGMAVVGVSGT